MTATATRKIPITERYSLQINKNGSQTILDTVLNRSMVLATCHLTGELVFETYDSHLINDIAVHLKYSIDKNGRKIK
jgi:hypothetical protein